MWGLIQKAVLLFAVRFLVSLGGACSQKNALVYSSEGYSVQHFAIG